MQCDQLQHHLDELLDRREELRSDSRLLAHLAACPACHRLARAYEAMLLGAELLGEFEPDAPLENLGPGATSGRIERMAPPGAHRRHYLAAVVLAASVLIMVYVSWRSLENGPSAGVPAAPGDVAGSASFTSVFLDELAVTLALKHVCHTTGQEIAVLPHTVRRVASHPETDRIVGHVRPFTDPFGATWQVLLRAWPGTTTPTSAIPESDTSLIRWHVAQYA